LWTLDGLDGIEPSTVTRALEDSSRDVRVSALRLAERWLGQANHPIQAAVLKRAEDADWAVRRQFAATLGAFPQNSPAEAALVALLERSGDDPLTVDAALSGLAGRESAILQRVLETPAQTPQRTAAITTLSATILKGGQDKPVQDLLQVVAESALPAWQRQALLAGAEAVLLGAPLTGAPAARGNASPAAANAPGARGGPGGARAFPDQPPATAATGAAGRGAAGAGRGAGAGGRGRGGGAPLSLSREPASFAALAGGELGPRVTNLLARMTWPGKAPAADAAPPLAPLTAVEQQLYNTGQTVYTSLCMACHQENGRGQEKLAPSLLGSQFVLAAPSIPIRILLQGKEGPVGLMPPLGAGLTDEQIAGALTYIRRNWGNAAPAVDPNAVKDTRAQTAGRTRPWTNDELLAIGGGRGGQAGPR
jgi:mono/diheme cytochrome c family protein